MPSNLTAFIARRDATLDAFLQDLDLALAVWFKTEM